MTIIEVREFMSALSPIILGAIGVYLDKRWKRQQKLRQQEDEKKEALRKSEIDKKELAAQQREDRLQKLILEKMEAFLAIGQIRSRGSD
jgi:transposase-like protein